MIQRRVWNNIKYFSQIFYLRLGSELAEFTILAELSDAQPLQVRPAGERHAVLVGPRRELFLLEEGNGELHVVAGGALPDLTYVEPAPSVSEKELRLSAATWAASESELLIGVDCALNVSRTAGEAPYRGTAHWLVLFRHAGESLSPVLLAPLGREPDSGGGLIRRWIDRLLRTGPSRAVLRVRKGPPDRGFRSFELVKGRGCRAAVERVFRWNGRRYLDSTLLLSAARDVESEMRRLGLWREDAPPRRFPDSSGTGYADFAEWIQFFLLPAARAIHLPDQPIPDVRGLCAESRRRLDPSRAAGLSSLLGRIEEQLAGKAETHGEEPVPVPPGIAGLQRNLRDRIRRIGG